MKDAVSIHRIHVGQVVRAASDARIGDTVSHAASDYCSRAFHKALHRTGVSRVPGSKHITI